MAVHNRLYAKKEPTEKSSVCTECRETDCSGCEVYRQKVPESDAPYAKLSRTSIEKQNDLDLKRAGIIALSFLTSLVNVTRVEDFPIEQLYVESFFSAVIYYLHFSTVRDAAEILIGGYLCWFFACTTKNKELTVILMTWLQTRSNSFRNYGKIFMLMHALFICVISYYMEVRKPYYVSILIFTFLCEYCIHISVNVAFYLEDVVCLLYPTILAIQYIQTNDVINCPAMQNLIISIIWLLTRYERRNA